MRIWSNGMTTGCQSVSGSSILPIRTNSKNTVTRTVKDIQSVDSLRPVNKGKFGVSVDKSGDMCIKGQKSMSFMLHM